MFACICREHPLLMDLRPKPDGKLSMNDRQHKRWFEASTNAKGSITFYVGERERGLHGTFFDDDQDNILNEN